MTESLKAVVSGSFKYKPEIDAAIDVFTEQGITVLEPTKGWLIISPGDLKDYAKQGRLRPLPTEERLTARQIESRFLRGIDRSDFMYVMNLEGYLGLSTALEIGYAMRRGVALYAREPLDCAAAGIDELDMRLAVQDAFTILPPEEVAAHLQQQDS
jgi:nucleoside 2-deoxyribosyltransferase